jgi:restriction system protein
LLRAVQSAEPRPSSPHEFANGKPLELIDGGNLLYLLQEHAGIEVKIVVPEDWVEPEPDA